MHACVPAARPLASKGDPAACSHRAMPHLRLSGRPTTATAANGDSPGTSPAGAGAAGEAASRGLPSAVPRAERGLAGVAAPASEWRALSLLKGGGLGTPCTCCCSWRVAVRCAASAAAWPASPSSARTLSAGLPPAPGGGEGACCSSCCCCCCSRRCCCSPCSRGGWALAGRGAAAASAPLPPLERRRRKSSSDAVGSAGSMAARAANVMPAEGCGCSAARQSAPPSPPPAEAADDSDADSWARREPLGRLLPPPGGALILQREGRPARRPCSRRAGAGVCTGRLVRPAGLFQRCCNTAAAGRNARGRCASPHSCAQWCRVLQTWLAIR